MRERFLWTAIELQHSHIWLKLRPGADEAKKAAVLEAWYRWQVREALGPLIAKWAKRMGVRAGRVRVQRMKTRWGSCNPCSASILINTELCRKTPECLEYIVVQESRNWPTYSNQPITPASSPSWTTTCRTGDCSAMS